MNWLNHIVDKNSADLQDQFDNTFYCLQNSMLQPMGTALQAHPVELLLSYKLAN